MKHKVGVPVVAQVRRFLALSIKEHTEIKHDYRTRDSKRDEHAEAIRSINDAYMLQSTMTAASLFAQ